MSGRPVSIAECGNSQSVPVCPLVRIDIDRLPCVYQAFLRIKPGIIEDIDLCPSDIIVGVGIHRVEDECQPRMQD